MYLVLARDYDQSEPLATAHRELRKSALDTVRNAGPGRVIYCHLEQPEFMIVDDRYVTVGSTNVGMRSHTTDSEMNIAVVDSALVDGVFGGTQARVGKFALELRLRVWNEHLNIPESELRDPIAAASRWPKQVPRSSRVHHAAYHAGDAPSKPITLWEWFRAVGFLRELAREPEPWPDANATDIDLIDAAAAVLETFDETFLKSSLSSLALGPAWWTPGVGLDDRLARISAQEVRRNGTCVAPGGIE